MLNVIPRFINDKYDDNVMQGDFDRSLEYLTDEKQITRALGYARDRNDVLYEGVLTYLRARIRYETGNYKAGTELNDTALPLIESMQWRDGVFHSMLLKAKLISVHDKEAAEVHLLSMAEDYDELKKQER